MIVKSPLLVYWEIIDETIFYESERKHSDLRPCHILLMLCTVWYFRLITCFQCKRSLLLVLSKSSDEERKHSELWPSYNILPMKLIERYSRENH